MTNHMITYLLSRRLQIPVDPITENVNSLLKKVVLEQVVLRVIRISLVIILPKPILIFNQILLILGLASQVRENSNKQSSNAYRGELERKVLLNDLAFKALIK